MGDTSSSILDQFIAIFVALFILSVITEKFGTLARKYPLQVQVFTLVFCVVFALIAVNTFCFLKNWESIILALLLFLSIPVIISGFFYASNRPPANKKSFWASIYKLNPFKHTAKRATNTANEETKEKEMTGLSILIGCIVALLLNASLVEMLKDGPENMDWSFQFLSFKYSFPIFDPSLSFSWIKLTGILFTGFFLSFGSKFFHDLLDQLYAVKKYKQKLKDDKTYEKPESVAQLETLVNTPESNFAALAYEKYKPELDKIEGIVYAGPALMDSKNGRVGCIEVNLLDSSSYDKVKDAYPISFPNGLTLQIPINKIITGKPELCSGPKGAGTLIGNVSGINGWGSAGCVVEKTDEKENNHYLLTCYHAVCSQLSLDSKPDSSNVRMKYDSKEVIIGTIEYGERTPQMDAALIKISKPSEVFSNRLIGFPKVIRKVDRFDMLRPTTVEVFGAESDKIYKGYIQHWSVPFTVDYLDKPQVTLNDTIKITRPTNDGKKPMSVPGDSGSLVRDSSNNAIGIIVGKDAVYSYAIKLSVIQDEYNIKLV